MGIRGKSASFLSRVFIFSVFFNNGFLHTREFFPHNYLHKKESTRRFHTAIKTPEDLRGV